MAFTPAIYVDRRRCIGCNACSLACKQENNFEHSPAVVARARTTMAASERWTEVYSYEDGSYPWVEAQVFAITMKKCTMCAHRLAAGLLPACVITCLGIARQFGDYETLKRRHFKAKQMGGGVKETFLFGYAGPNPSTGHNHPPPSGYIPRNDCRQCHR